MTETVAPRFGERTPGKGDLRRRGHARTNRLGRRGSHVRSREGIVTPLSACDLSRVWLANSMQKISYDGYRFPPAIIRQAIWLYLRSMLSLRDVDDLLAERGIIRPSKLIFEPNPTIIFEAMPGGALPVPHDK